MLDRHGYLSQEGVNLLLTGAATSNVFDGERALGDDKPPGGGAAESGGGDVVRLRGVGARAPVGFLSLHEAYDYFRVGRHYKTPRSPVWVVYSESHYSLLFSRDARTLGWGACDDGAAPGGDVPCDGFDLFYWDMLADQVRACCSSCGRVVRRLDDAGFTGSAPSAPALRARRVCQPARDSALSPTAYFPLIRS